MDVPDRVDERVDTDGWSGYWCVLEIALDTEGDAARFTMLDPEVPSCMEQPKYWHQMGWERGAWYLRATGEVKLRPQPPGFHWRWVEGPPDLARTK